MKVKIKSAIKNINPRSPKSIILISIIAVIPIVLVLILTFSKKTPIQYQNQNPENGMIYEGLGEKKKTGKCRGIYEIRTKDGNSICTHGPDPAPPSIDVRKRQDPGFTLKSQSFVEDKTRVAGITCEQDGQSGKRVQLIYARPSNKADSYANYLPDFKKIAIFMNKSFVDSAAKTGGNRFIRYVHDGNCEPIIENVEISSNADDSFDNMVNELRSKGYNRDDRKYLVWRDTNKICGLANLSWNDDKPGLDNESNAKTGFTFIDNGCWGLEGGKAETHELGHVLGAVKSSVPRSAGEGHCTDPYDNMCRGTDTAKGKVPQICPQSQDGIFDCNNDDYFSTNPPAGSYLATHWNVANSQFLGGSSSSTPTATPTPTPTRVLTPTPTGIPSVQSTPSPTLTQVPQNSQPSPSPIYYFPGFYCGGSQYNICTPTPNTNQTVSPTKVAPQPAQIQSTPALSVAPSITQSPVATEPCPDSGNLGFLQQILNWIQRLMGGGNNTC